MAFIQRIIWIVGYLYFPCTYNQKQFFFYTHYRIWNRFLYWQENFFEVE